MADLLQPRRVIPMLLALVAVVIVAPFEHVLFTRPGLTVTTVEVALLCVLAVYAREIFRHRRAALPPLPLPVTTTAVALLVSLAIAAWWTSFEPANAVRFVARMLLAAALALAAAHVIDSRQRARLLARVIVCVATFVAAIAVLEGLQWPPVMTALTAFRPGFHVVAGQLRATSTLMYPTITSMYLEVAFAVGLWLLMSPRESDRRVRALAFGALVIIGAGISATFTRAGLFAMMAALGVMASLRVGQLRVLTALTAVLIAVVFLAHSPGLLAARMTTEGSGAWYGAEYRVPSAIAMTTADVHRVPVTLTNTGRLTWSSHEEPAFALAYHWLTNDGAVVEFEGRRTPFAAPVRPGQRVQLDADVIAPGEPGTYTLVWDIVHETRAWLSTEGVTAARSRVTVSGAPHAIAGTRLTALPVATMPATRPQLWAAAMHIAQEHPLLGIGPDNYRLAYGPYLGRTRWDTRVHANNMYLEVLVGAGAIGFIALIAFVGAVGVVLWQRGRAAGVDQRAAAAGAIAVWLVIAGHGLVDSFLSFTTTYVTFAVVGGWALSRGLVEGVRDAHRI